MAKIKKQDEEITTLKEQLNTLSKEQLEEIVFSGAQKYQDFKRDLIVQLVQDKEKTLKTICLHIDQAFPDIEDGYFDAGLIIERIDTILKSVENAGDDMKVQAYWKTVDRILYELNEFGMEEEWLEDFALESLDKIVKIFSQNKTLSEKKREIIGELMDYYTWGNCGIVDSIYESVHQLCSEKEDYQIVIEKLESHVKKASFKSYYQRLLANLYERIGDSESKLKTLESHLEYGVDYWQLAEYWIETGDYAKALQIVQQGLEKGRGRKNELYQFMQEHYLKQNDFDKIFQLLQTRIEKSELEYHKILHTDPIYKFLCAHYTRQNDYNGLVRILELHISHNFINLDFYKLSEKTLKPDDWLTFDKRIIEKLEQAIHKQKPTGSFSLWGIGQYKEELNVLAQIYNHKNDIDKLFETIKDYDNLLVEYEKKLIQHYPAIYIDKYREKIFSLIAIRGRENYKQAAKYAQTVKKIYQSILKKPAEWEVFISKLRHEHRNLPALQQEFSKL